MKLIDHKGQRFGRLLVLEKDSKPRMWRCRCDCGGEHLVAGSNLRNGSIRSCGCLASEWATELGGRLDFIAKRALSVTRHGHKRRGQTSLEYKIWLGMKRRCNNPKNKSFPHWGGRGIRICDRWESSFEAFLADMGPRPTPQHSIDRIKNHLGYSPANCRWATPAVQGANKSTNISVTVNGVVFESMAAACRHFGVNTTTAHLRVASGIDPSIAVSHVGRLRPRRR